MIAASLALTIALRQPVEITTLAKMAASEFRATGSSEDWSASKPYHARALPYFRSRSKDELRRELEPVYKGYAVGSMEACGAAYVMALHGVDVDKNVARLSRMRQSEFGATDAVESLPEALADIVLRQHSRAALLSLVDMETDGFITEIQAIEVARVFAADPTPMMELAKDKKRFIVIAAEIGYGEGEDSYSGKTEYRGVAKSFAKLAKTQYRGLASRLKKAVAASDLN